MAHVNSVQPCLALTLDYVQSRLHYEPTTGELFWKPMTDGRRGVGSWNARCAGKIAGSVNNEGYRSLSLGGGYYLAHRLIWFLEVKSWPKLNIDHADGNKLNNRFSNLREATRSDNAGNSLGHKNKKGDLPKNIYQMSSGRFRASIFRLGKDRHLGVFSTLLEAEIAVRAAQVEAFGEFAVCNRSALAERGAGSEV